MSADSKQRFSSRVEQYVKYRPSYPAAVLDYLRATIGLQTSWTIADLGSGTGISSQLFLGNGNTVIGIEPNEPMRRAAEQGLAGERCFSSVDASAEQTTLPSASVDLVIAGQAFHWFDPAKAKLEFARILRPGGAVVLLWNTRRTTGSELLEAYERLLRMYGTDYERVRHENIDRAALDEFFAPSGCELAKFENEQPMDYASFEGRLLSSSYVPTREQAGADKMLAELRDIFARCQMNGRVSMIYDTEVYVGRVS